MGWWMSEQVGAGGLTTSWPHPHVCELKKMRYGSEVVYGLPSPLTEGVSFLWVVVGRWEGRRGRGRGGGEGRGEADACVAETTTREA